MSSQGLKLLYRVAGDSVAARLQHSAITPNQITVFSGVIATISMLLFLQFGEKGRIDIWAVVLLLGTQVALVLDYADGSLARLRSKVSDFGKFLDASLDSIKLALLLLVVFLMAEGKGDTMVIFLVTLLFGIDQRVKLSFAESWSKGDSDLGKKVFSRSYRSIAVACGRLFFGFSLASFYLMLTLWLVSGLLAFPFLLVIAGFISIVRNSRTALKSAKG